MTNKKKIAPIVFIMFLIALIISVASAQTATIACDPTNANPGDSVTVDGTNFGASCDVGLAFGEEVTVTGEAHPFASVSGTGPFTQVTNHYPIKPGSFSFHCDVSGVTSDYVDNGDGTLQSSSPYAVDPFVNYVNGTFGRSSNTAWDGYDVVFTANYTYYMYNVTPAEGVTSDPSGVFSASITVPAVDVGYYDVTAVDTQGRIATSPIQFQVVPEVLTFGVMVLLSSVSVLVGSHYLWNRSKKREK